jgi:hypothetical protein
LGALLGRSAASVERRLHRNPQSQPPGAKFSRALPDIIVFKCALVAKNLPSAHRDALSGLALGSGRPMASDAKPTGAASERETPGGAAIALDWPSALLGIS